MLALVRLPRETTPWLTFQAAAALATAFVSGLTWHRRPRYGLWFLFGAGFAVFILIVDFSEFLEDSPMFDVVRSVEALVAGRYNRAGDIASAGLADLGTIVLPAALLGWLAQLAVPARLRRVPDQAADYTDHPGS